MVRGPGSHRKPRAKKSRGRRNAGAKGGNIRAIMQSNSALAARALERSRKFKEISKTLKGKQEPAAEGKE